MKKYIVSSGKWLFLFCSFILIGDLFAVFVQFLRGNVLNKALDIQLDSFAFNIILLLSAIIMEIFFMYLSFRMENKFKNSSLKQIKEDLFGAIVNSDYREIMRDGSDEYLAKYTVTLPEVQNRYISSITLLLMLGFKIITVTIALVVLDWRLAIVTLLLLSMPLYVPKIFEKRIQSFQNYFVENSNEFISFLSSTLSGLEVIKNFSIEKRFIEKFEGINKDVYNSSLKNDNYGAFMRILMSCMSYLSYFIVIAFSGYLVFTKEFNAGEFFVAVGMIDQLSYPIISISGCIQSILSMKKLNADLYDFISRKRIDNINAYTFSDSIECTDVGFKYEGADELLFSDCNFKFEKGRKYLITGENGSGKTTFINCLLRYHDICQGEILLDKTNISTYNHIYNICAVMRQNVFVFNDTMRNNVTFFDDSIPDQKIIDILMKIKLEKYASVEGLNTFLGADGIQLSGGEKRKLALARVMLADKDILILDEPLANLDQESKEIIISNISSLKNKTVIVISHEWTKIARNISDYFCAVYQIK